MSGTICQQISRNPAEAKLPTPCVCSTCSKGSLWVDNHPVSEHVGLGDFTSLRVISRGSAVHELFLRFDARLDAEHYRGVWYWGRWPPPFNPVRRGR
jgi:hypothetical protein